jgi:serine/threonine protein phosphatase 1
MQKSSKTFVIGDVHGNHRALLQCLEKSGFDKENDTLISLGDIADGWSEVSECVDELLSIKNLICIRGNHDVWCHDWFVYGRTPLIWTAQGGVATMESYVRTGKLVDGFHKDFWKDQIDYYIDDQNRLFIHGGWDYLEGFPRGAMLPVNAGSIAKECHWDRSLLMSAKAAFGKNNNKPNAKFNALEEFTEIYIGHTAENDGPNQYGNLWNLDTGAGWSGVLTILDVNTKEFWQSDFATLLYPDEKGRG